MDELVQHHEQDHCRPAGNQIQPVTRCGTDSGGAADGGGGRQPFDPVVLGRKDDESGSKKADPHGDRMNGPRGIHIHSLARAVLLDGEDPGDHEQRGRHAHHYVSPKAGRLFGSLPLPARAAEKAAARIIRSRNSASIKRLCGMGL